MLFSGQAIRTNASTVVSFRTFHLSFAAFHSHATVGNIATAPVVIGGYQVRRGAMQTWR